MYIVLEWIKDRELDVSIHAHEEDDLSSKIFDSREEAMAHMEKCDETYGTEWQVVGVKTHD